MKLGKDWILETTELIDQMYLDNELTPEEHSELDYILYEMVAIGARRVKKSGSGLQIFAG